MVKNHSILTKKTKKNTNADFKKIKSKLGKKAPKATNATNTQFRTKRVVVREQSVAQAEKANEEVSKERRLTVDQLTSLARHHNPKTRKEAYVQLMELAQLRFSTNNEVKRSFSTAIDLLAEGMSDVEEDVRSAFLNFLDALMSEKESKEWFLPHFAFYMKQVHSNLTIPNLSRRIDTMKVFEIITKHHAEYFSIKESVDVLTHVNAICASILGTSASSLAKGGTLEQAKASGQADKTNGSLFGILKKMKLENEEKKKEKKIKRSGERADFMEKQLDYIRLNRATEGMHCALRLFDGGREEEEGGHSSSLYTACRLGLELLRNAKWMKDKGAIACTFFFF